MRRPLLTSALAAVVAAALLGVATGPLHASPGPSPRVKGATALAEQPSPQETSPGLRPDPGKASTDRAGIVTTGCMVGIDGISSGRCLFGDPKGNSSLILFGDSHAMQYFPPLQILAKEHGWRLYVINKRECPPPSVQIRGFFGGPYRDCATWRRTELARIARFGPRTTVIMSGDTSYTAFSESGAELRGLANGKAQEDGYVITLSRIIHAGPRAVVIRDLPTAPRDMPLCIANHLRHLRACAFRRVRQGAEEFDVRAARAVAGAFLIDPLPQVCPHGLCRAVIGDAIVYRDRQHLTATYSRTLAQFIGEALREAGVGAAPAPAPEPPGPVY